MSRKRHHLSLKSFMIVLICILLKGEIMIFAFVLIILFIAMFVKLGMYSVWYSILVSGLKMALLIITGLAAIIIWRKLFKNESQK